jgi:hypothetical protein
LLPPDSFIAHVAESSRDFDLDFHYSALRAIMNSAPWAIILIVNLCALHLSLSAYSIATRRSSIVATSVAKDVLSRTADGSEKGW